MNPNSLPVVVIGAGPVGLAAAVHLLNRGLQPVLLEAGDSVGAGMLQWAHVRMFSPWEFSIDKQAGALLARHGWRQPDLSAFPTGGEVVTQYLRPLAETPELSPYLHLNSRVLAVSKLRRDRMKNDQRDELPFVVRYEDRDGEHELLAQAVIDASGTIDHPNPLGASGLPALGERALQERIFYGMPNVLGHARTRYAGKRTLVVGSGHSAFNVLSDLAKLAAEVPGTSIHWAIRRTSLQRVLGGGDNDQLKERGRLGQSIAKLVETGALTLHTGFQLERLQQTPDGIVASGMEQRLPAVDEIVACTGFRPNLDLLAELRVAVDLGTQAPVALAPLIDPNLHSCGSVRPHGVDELKHPDANIYLVGMKSYGRAPTFLLLTGYEQVRSVVAAIAGDWESARRVELVLPETGVCITDFVDAPVGGGCCGPSATAAETMATSCQTASDRCGSNAATASIHAPADSAAATDATSCCGGPALINPEACCVADESAKANGQSGCGCSRPARSSQTALASANACCH